MIFVFLFNTVRQRQKRCNHTVCLKFLTQPAIGATHDITVRYISLLHQRGLREIVAQDLFFFFFFFFFWPIVTQSKTKTILNVMKVFTWRWNQIFCLNYMQCSNLISCKRKPNVLSRKQKACDINFSKGRTLSWRWYNSPVAKRTLETSVSQSCYGGNLTLQLSTRLISNSVRGWVCIVSDKKNTCVHY